MRETKNVLNWLFVADPDDSEGTQRTHCADTVTKWRHVQEVGSHRHSHHYRRYDMHTQPTSALLCATAPS